MLRTIPIYYDHDERYRADTCRPLVDAAAKGEVRFKALRHGHYPGRLLPDKTLPGVKMVGYWDAKEDQTWGLPWHRNEGVELTFLESGSLRFAVDQREYCLQPNDLTITRPWQLHRVGCPNVSVSHLIWLIIDVGVRRPHQPWQWPPWVVLTRPDLDQLTDLLRHNEQPVWRATTNIRCCFQAIARALETDRDRSSISLLAVRLNELLLLVLDMLREKRLAVDRSLSSTRRTVELFLEDLRTHPEHLAMKWNLKTMAESCGLGITQFVHHVRSLTNMSPARFLNKCRLDLAAKLLEGTSEPSITEIALACGFSSSQYFATCFAKRFGCNPRSFRARRCPAQSSSKIRLGCPSPC
jgi:AraC-like DNA-binding protein